MTVYRGTAKYVPGMYVKKKPKTSESVDQYFREWEKKTLETKKEPPAPQMPPAICFSRKIGVGALEVADILAEKIGYRVVDREIIEYIAKKAKIREDTISIFDELYPGKMNEFIALLFGEKSFIKSDYSRHLFRAVLSIAYLGPTIFVGRGAHLILPRDRVMVVRFISDKQHRINRLHRLLEVKKKEAETKLSQVDKEQREFFKKVFGKKEASAYEFDVVINFDYIGDPQSSAAIVETAFLKKFGSEFAGGPL